MNFIFALQPKEILLFCAVGILGFVLLPAPLNWISFIGTLGTCAARQRHNRRKFYQR